MWDGLDDLPLAGSWRDKFRPAPQDGTARGDVIAGKYRVEKIIGEGGMGIVFAAHHLMLGSTRYAPFVRSE